MMIGGSHASTSSGVSPIEEFPSVSFSLVHLSSFVSVDSRKSWRRRATPKEAL